LCAQVQVHMEEPCFYVLRTKYKLWRCVHKCRYTWKSHVSMYYAPSTSWHTIRTRTSAVCMTSLGSPWPSSALLKPRNSLVLSYSVLWRPRSESGLVSYDIRWLINDIQEHTCRVHYIYYPSVRLTVCPLHGLISQKRLLGLCIFSPC